MAPKSVPVPMIRRVRLKNFRSIAECDVELGPLTLLVGPNGSGKSNFLHALDFLSDAVNNGLESAVERRGGMNSLLSRWALDDANPVLNINVALELHEGRTGNYMVELRRSPSAGFELAREQCVVTTTRGGHSLAEFDVRPDGSEWHDVRGIEFIPKIFPGLGSPTLTLPHVAEHLNFGLVHRALKGISCYSLHVDEMRKPQESDGGERLKANGSNVASVLSRMLAQNLYGVIPADRLGDWVQVISPGTVSIRPVRISGYTTLKFGQVSSDGQVSWDFDASEISYGTMRTLGVLVALYQGRMRDISPVTLVGIEEPESAVHPGAATAILGAMAEASLVTQVLATTHSPAMLDDDDLDFDIIRGVSRVDGRTIIGRVDAASRQILEQQLYTAGELLRMGHLLPEKPSNGTVQPTAAASA